MRRTLVLSLATTACGVSSGPVGDFCGGSQTCAHGQTCADGVCGRCRNGEPEAGEVCYADARFQLLETRAHRFIPVDLDGDRVLDLVGFEVDPPANRLLLYRADRDRRFVREPGLALADVVVDVHAADVDGTGTLDLVVAHPDGVSVVFRDGDLLNPGGKLVFGGTVTDVAAVTFAGGAGVVVTAGGGQGRVGVSAVRSDQSIAPLGAPLEVGANPILAGPVAVGADPVLDVVVVAGDTGQVSLVRATPGGAVQRTEAFTLGRGVAAAAADDVDFDGVVDLVLASFDGTVSIASGDGVGGFGITETLDAGSTVSSLVLGDVDVDAEPDILATSAASSVLTLWPGRDGAHPRAITIDGTAVARQVFVGAFDADDDDDILLVENATASIRVLGGEP